MIGRLNLGWLAFVLLLVGALPAVQAADEAAANQAIAKLLDVGWSTSPLARKQADVLLARSATAIAGDLRALEAWTLILIQQRRYDEASKRVDQWLGRDRDNLFALRSRVWLSTLLKNYPAALVSAEKLAEQVRDADPAADNVEELNELAAFLGRMYGYLGGPAGVGVNQDERKNSERRVVERLGTARLAMFEEARDSVLQQHLELTDSKADEREKARDAVAIERENTLTEVASEREKMESRTDDLKDQRNKLEGELNDELQQIAREDRPLAEQYARLDARGTSIARELGSYQSQIDRLEFDASREKDPGRRDSLRREADRLRFFAVRLDGDLALIRREGTIVNQQRAALAARAQQAQNNFGGQIVRIDRELQGMTKRDRQLDGIANRAKRPISGTTGQVLALGAQASALTTYDTLPLEQARQRILDAIR